MASAVTAAMWQDEATDTSYVTSMSASEATKLAMREKFSEPDCTFSKDLLPRHARATAAQVTSTKTKNEAVQERRLQVMLEELRDDQFMAKPCLPRKTSSVFRRVEALLAEAVGDSVGGAGSGSAGREGKAGGARINAADRRVLFQLARRLESIATDEKAREEFAVRLEKILTKSRRFEHMGHIVRQAGLVPQQASTETEPGASATAAKDDERREPVPPEDAQSSRARERAQAGQRGRRRHRQYTTPHPLAPCDERLEAARERLAIVEAEREERIAPLRHAVDVSFGIPEALALERQYIEEARIAEEHASRCKAFLMAVEMIRRFHAWDIGLRRGRYRAKLLNKKVQAAIGLQRVWRRNSLIRSQNERLVMLQSAHMSETMESSGGSSVNDRMLSQHGDGSSRLIDMGGSGGLGDSSMDFFASSRRGSSSAIPQRAHSILLRSTQSGSMLRTQQYAASVVGHFLATYRVHPRTAIRKLKRCTSICQRTVRAFLACTAARKEVLRMVYSKYEAELVRPAGVKLRFVEHHSAQHPSHRASRQHLLSRDLTNTQGGAAGPITGSRHVGSTSGSSDSSSDMLLAVQAASAAASALESSEPPETGGGIGGHASRSTSRDTLATNSVAGGAMTGRSMHADESRATLTLGFGGGGMEHSQSHHHRGESTVVNRLLSDLLKQTRRQWVTGLSSLSLRKQLWVSPRFVDVSVQDARTFLLEGDEPGFDFRVPAGEACEEAFQRALEHKSARVPAPCFPMLKLVRENQVMAAVVRQAQTVLTIRKPASIMRRSRMPLPTAIEEPSVPQLW